MFLNAVCKQNPALVEAAISLHEKGIINPDTYVLDLDIIKKNAHIIKEQAEKHNIELFYMLKQIGRNPYVAKQLGEVGITHAVAVDFRETLLYMKNKLPLGNVGHLVQLPYSLLEQVMAYGTKYITVYGIEMLRAINVIAQKLGKKQAVLLRVVSDNDITYAGQHGGFSLANLYERVQEFKKLLFVKIKGVTSFPCFLFNESQHKIEHTANCETLLKAQKILVEAYDQEAKELNMPSATCFTTIPQIKKLGGTLAEPGHSLTGTTPLHAFSDQPEICAILYISEVSHHVKQNSYVYGGGYYRRSKLENALVIDVNTGERARANVLPFPPESIDYYLEVIGKHRIFSPVLMAPRTQIFVTRSEVAIVANVQSGSPEVVGIYDGFGNLIRR